MAQLLLTPGEVNALEAQADLGFQLLEGILTEGVDVLPKIFDESYRTLSPSLTWAELHGLSSQGQVLSKAYEALDFLLQQAPRLHARRLQVKQEEGQDIHGLDYAPWDEYIENDMAVRLDDGENVNVPAYTPRTIATNISININQLVLYSLIKLSTVNFLFL